ncbi:C40 family peptidase [uncultured Lacinutrix sp.]|uniref:C40 family peptidase n=1 Tax=uncultured Lacinutrix sp. TaxID=574032 RepID=UPI002607720E|nr:C40 family peptidase [uncultured Lacinutrix sp.]
MPRKVLILLILITLTSCGSSKSRRVVTKKSSTTKTVKKSTTKRKATKRLTTKTTTIKKTVATVVKNAKKYEGTRYKYGGTTKKGMDCSGLVYTAFKEADINIPRVSSAMATHGNWIDLKKVEIGDLLFFATAKNSRKVNHVGIVTKASFGNVEFIHSSTSKGVITSKLEEKYWYFAFVQARRVL